MPERLLIDLHTHTLLSDGALLPSELARRAENIGYKIIGMTDHVDASNVDFVIPRLVAAALVINRCSRIKVIAGAELTHIPPPLIPDFTRKARELGAAYVVVHGETLVEPVAPGTNWAAIEAGVDILAHPGLITAEEVKSARERGVRLEITTRKGHSLTNGHVARLGREIGVGLVLNTDTHGPEDLATLDFARKVVLGAGLTEEDFDLMQAGALELIAGLPEPWSLTLNQ